MARDFSGHLRVDLRDMTDEEFQNWSRWSRGLPPPAGPAAPDPVNHPAHYTAGAVECIDAIRAALGPEGFIAYCRGQVMKYTWRAGLKGPALEDARKAAWYQARLVKELEG